MESAYFSQAGPAGSGGGKGTYRKVGRLWVPVLSPSLASYVTLGRVLSNSVLRSPRLCDEVKNTCLISFGGALGASREAFSPVPAWRA